eukprot:6055499-Karenia_brevis.AAC.1
MGDFNIQRIGAQRLAYSGDKILQEVYGHNAGLSFTSSEKTWCNVLARMSEITQPSTTCVHAGSKAESTIDRVFLGSPAWVVRLLDIEAN